MAVYQGQTGGGLNAQKMREGTMRNRYANTRTSATGDITGYTGMTGAGARAGVGRTTQKKGGFGFPMGGFGGGGRGGAAFAEEDLARQLEYDKAIWERSTPNVSGVGANVTWDRDTNTVSSALTEDNQSIYDSAFDRQGMFGGQVDYLAAGGWQDAQQKRFEQMQAMFVDQDLEADAKRKAASYNTGESTTQRMMSDLAFDKNINNRELGLLNQAFTESQSLIDSGINRQNNYIDQRTGLENLANNMIVTPTPNTAGNMGNVSLASTRWADNLAMENAKKAKGQSDFFGSLLSGIFS